MTSAESRTNHSPFPRPAQKSTGGKPSGTCALTAPFLASVPIFTKNSENKLTLTKTVMI